MGWRRAGAALAMAAAVLLTAPAVRGPSIASAASPGVCTFSGAGGFAAAIPPPATGDPSVIRVVGDDAHPIPEVDLLAIDTGDPRGRVFAASELPQSHSPLTVIAGRPLDASRIAVESTLPVGLFITGLAVDSATGRVYLADVASCQLVVVDGRADPPSIVTRVDLPGNPGAVAIDSASGRIVVDIPDQRRVLLLDRSLVIRADLVSSHPITGLLDDPARQEVFVDSDPATDEIDGVDLQAASPSLSTVAAASGIVAVDDAHGLLFTADPAHGTISSWRLAGGVGTAAQVGPPLALGFGRLSIQGPMSQTIAGAVVPGTSELLVVAGTAPQYAIVRVAPDGRLSRERLVAGLAGGDAVAADPATGRVFVALTGSGRVAVYYAPAAGAPAPPAPSLTYELPGPLQISLAPQDVARSLGVTTLIMLLLGAPTPLFNATLSANRRLIERWGRRRVPRRIRRRASAKGAVTTVPIIVGLSRTPAGRLLYLGVTGVLYSLLVPQFPFTDGARTFAVTVAALAIGTALSQIPGELYVRRRFGSGGRIQVALWTLGLAAACVVVTRLTGFQPGYVYGIIGGFTFTATLTADDRGRMAWRGMGALLLAGFAAWFLRIPFQPGTGVVGGDAGAVANQLLAGVFISAVESSAIGLVPLRFLSGATLFSWSRVRWGVLWALGLMLFAHVILYPVSSLEPTPSAMGLWTVLLSVALYGGAAIAFWWFFRRRAARHDQRLRTTGASKADADGDPTGDPIGDTGDSAAGAGTVQTGAGVVAAGGVATAPSHGTPPSSR
ncbi:MAG TPA: FGLLP motif-containing membrane protein [Candidatus Dormibacteraeota bacterium]|nr:FGLLP motif-containing membrane protein [Candidatus Dormibacteraeota bacterium]